MVELADILRRIVRRRRLRLEEAKTRGEPEPFIDGLTAAAGGRTNRFVEGLQSVSGPAIIAEIKMGSPRLGSLVETLDPTAQAEVYAKAGAAALSVVVEPDFFYGSYALLQRCREASGLPTLAKDFVVDPLQLHWARRAGADAVLLIAALMSAAELRGFASLARELALVPLVECHTTGDIEKLVGGDWELVGLNNRDLRTFEVSLQQSVDLVARLPLEAIKVAESGIASATDVARLTAAGFEAFLVGEALLLASDPAAKLAELREAGRQ